MLERKTGSNFVFESRERLWILYLKQLDYIVNVTDPGSQSNIIYDKRVALARVAAEVPDDLPTGVYGIPYFVHLFIFTAKSDFIVGAQIHFTVVIDNAQSYSIQPTSPPQHVSRELLVGRKVDVGLEV